MANILSSLKHSINMCKISGHNIGKYCSSDRKCSEIIIKKLDNGRWELTKKDRADDCEGVKTINYINDIDWFTLDFADKYRDEQNEVSFTTVDGDYE